MIESVRIWTRKPSSRLFAMIESKEPKPKREKRARAGFFSDFIKMWENHADMVVRNLDAGVE